MHILLVDDHAVVREGYRRLLEDIPDVETIAEAGSGEEAYRLYSERSYDLVIMDLSLPGMSGLETLRRLRQRDWQARVLVFSVHERPALAENALETGALGYITKASAPDVLVEAVRNVSQGQRYLSADIAGALTLHRADTSNIGNVLSTRELEILRLMAEGKGLTEISVLLSISYKTVANYGSSIRSKLGTTSVAELTRIAIREGLARP